MPKYIRDLKTRREIGRRLRCLRKEAGLTQIQLGGRVKLTGAQISKYERGASDISHDLFIKILDALDYTEEDYNRRVEYWEKYGANYEDPRAPPKKPKLTTLEEVFGYTSDRYVSKMQALSAVGRDVYNLAVQLQELPEELTLALKKAIDEAPKRPYHLAKIQNLIWILHVLRHAQDEVEKEMMDWPKEDDDL